MTLKLPFFDQPTTRHHASSRMIRRPLSLLRYVTPDTDPSLYHLFLFLEVEKNKKKQRYDKDTHPTMIHPPMLFWASLAKWLSVRLRTKWFWIRAQLQYLEMLCTSCFNTHHDVTIIERDKIV